MQDKIIILGESHICTKKYEKNEKYEKRVTVVVSRYQKSQEWTHKEHRCSGVLLIGCSRTLIASWPER